MLLNKRVWTDLTSIGWVKEAGFQRTCMLFHLNKVRKDYKLNYIYNIYI